MSEQLPPWPDPCCQGAVPINRDGMALHPYGASCADCGRDRVRCFARWDPERDVHVCSDCDPRWQAFRAEQRATRRKGGSSW